VLYLKCTVSIAITGISFMHLQKKRKLSVQRLLLKTKMTN